MKSMLGCKVTNFSLYNVLEHRIFLSIFFAKFICKDNICGEQNRA